MGAIRSGSWVKRMFALPTVSSSRGYNRRNFLQAVGSVALIALLPGTSSGLSDGLSDKPATSLDLANLSQHTAQALQRMLRLLFPHNAIDDGPYIAVVGAFDQMAAAPEMLTLLNTGVQQLDAADPEPWLKLSESKQLEVLAEIESTAFFQTVRVTGRFLFYDNKEVWPVFGYEGSSSQHGGYLHRGFNDLNWLPEPEG